MFSRLTNIAIVKLLMRFYDLTGGRILIDGNNINDFTRKWILCRTLQQPILRWRRITKFKKQHYDFFHSAVFMLVSVTATYCSIN